MAFTVTGLDGSAIPDLRVAVYSPRNTPAAAASRPQDGRQAGRGRLTCRLTAPVHRQGFATAIKDIPGGSRGAMGSTGTCPGHSDDRLPGAPGTAVILMIHCRGLRWLTAPLYVSSWSRFAIGQSPG